tara:strand:+ start:330 stop:938 length:609 start_codon:yes stop_codon:yes gene_type:complete
MTEQNNEMYAKLQRLRYMVENGSLPIPRPSLESHYVPNENPERKAQREISSKGTAYSSQEDQKLLNAYKKYGNKWTIIQKEVFNGERTAKSIQNRHKLLTEKQPVKKSYAFNKKTATPKKSPIRQPVRAKTSSARRPTPVKSTTNAVYKPFIERKKSVYVKRKDKNDRIKEYRVFQGPKGGFVFKVNGEYKKINSKTGFIYK